MMMVEYVGRRNIMRPQERTCKTNFKNATDVHSVSSRYCNVAEGPNI